MAELGFQVSTKTNDGTIFVIADATYTGFAQKLSEALDQSGAEALLQAMANAFAQPMSTQQIANALGGTVITTDKWNAPAQPNTPVASIGVEALKDRYGNEWTYGLPDAPPLPDGRGFYAKKRGISKAGKSYVGWFDPVKGPKPFKSQTKSVDWFSILRPFLAIVKLLVSNVFFKSTTKILSPALALAGNVKVQAADDVSARIYSLTVALAVVVLVTTVKPILLCVTTPGSIVQVKPEALTVISPLSPSVNGIAVCQLGLAPVPLVCNSCPAVPGPNLVKFVPL